MNERILEMQIAAMRAVWAGDDPDGDVDKMYIPRVFAEKFARLIIQDCAGVFEAIDNGNTQHGTMNYLKALQTRYYDKGVVKQ